MFIHGSPLLDNWRVDKIAVVGAGIEGVTDEFVTRASGDAMRISVVEVGTGGAATVAVELEQPASSNANRITTA